MLPRNRNFGESARFADAPGCAKVVVEIVDSRDGGSMTPAKPRLNWILIGSLMGSVLILGVVLRLVHDWQMKVHAQTIQAQIDQAEGEHRLGDAINALQRFLALYPGNTEALARLGNLLEETADSPAGWSRALMVNENVLAREVANHALRRRVAELAIKLNDYQLAEDHLTQLRRALPEDGEVAARLGDVLLMAGKPNDAVLIYQDSIKAQPKQTLAYARLARLYLTSLNQPVLADRTIASMVQAQPENAQVYLQRGYHHRFCGKSAEAEADFTRALKLDSNAAGPLLALTRLALTQGRYQEARELLDRGVTQHPDHLVWYRDGAELELVEGHPDQALSWVERGLKVAPEDAYLWLLRTEALARKKEFQAARTNIESLRQLPQAPNDLADYLEARLLLQEGAVTKARERLQGLQSSPSLNTWLRARVDLTLAEVAGMLGQPNQQVVELRRAVELDRSLRKESVLLGQLLLDQGKIEEARRHLLQLTQDSEPPPEAYLTLARASVLYYLGKPEAERNWNEATQALQRLQEMPRFEVESALIRADILLAQNKGKEAESTLAGASSRHPENARLWAARVALARRQGNTPQAQALEAEALKVVHDPTLLRLSTLEAGNRVPAADLRAAQEDLEKRVDSLPLPQRLVVLRALGQRDPEGAARRLAELKPASERSLTPALELALLGRDTELVKSVVEAFRQLEGENSPAARLGQAAWNVRVARRGRTDLLTEARPVLESVAQERPTWAAPHTWLGRLAMQLGQQAEATQAFLKAFQRGERNLLVCLQLLELLLEQNQVAQADGVYRQLEREILPSGELARIGAQIAQVRNEYPRALRLAEEARPPGPPNPGYLLWRASLLSKINELPEALLNVREAMRIDPVNPDGWVLWVELLMKRGRAGDIDEVLNQIKQRQPVDLQTVTLAQCEAARGNVEAAASYFRQALERDPRDVYALWTAAQFYVHNKDTASARPLVERLRQLAPVLTAAQTQWIDEQLKTNP